MTPEPDTTSSLTTRTDDGVTVRTTTVPGEHAMVGLLGTRDHLLKVVEDAFDVHQLVGFALLEQGDRGSFDDADL